MLRKYQIGMRQLCKCLRFWKRTAKISMVFSSDLNFIRELKHRSFWATDVNRKFMFLFLARFNAQPMSYKALILAFTTWHFRRKGSNTRRRGKVSTSGWRPWLKNVFAKALYESMCTKTCFETEVTSNLGMGYWYTSENITEQEIMLNPSSQKGQSFCLSCTSPHHCWGGVLPGLSKTNHPAGDWGKDEQGLSQRGVR